MHVKTHKVLKAAKNRALIDNDTYLDWYRQSTRNPEKFWKKNGKRIDWFKPYKKVKNTSFDGKVSIKWFEDGVTNVAYNCIDRHLKDRGEQVAIIWEGDNPYDDKKVTYNELYDKVCRLSNVMKSHGVKKGDRGHHLHADDRRGGPMRCSPAPASAPFISIVFGGFSPDALAGRIVDCDSTFVITADEGLPRRQDDSAEGKHRQGHRDRREEEGPGEERGWWCAAPAPRSAGKTGATSTTRRPSEAAKPVCAPARMKAEDPLFILYTSGSTGKPKGVLHTTGGYLVYASMTHEYVFDYHDGDIYWCTADVGWVTGHSYIVYGPLANGATTLMFEGVPNYPDAVAASGRSSTSTRSTSSTPRRPPSAP